MAAQTQRPADTAARSRNELRPVTWDDVVGQERAKSLMQRAAKAAVAHKRPLEHTLLVAASGTGKTTFSHVIANTLGVDVYEVEAPISYDTLKSLRTQMYSGDILKIEEIHQQAIMERRGRSASVQPEVLYSVMEDRVLQTQGGPVPFPRITIIGTTTDEGMLPDAFVNRFPLRPRLEPYTTEQLATIARSNAGALDIGISDDAVLVFAQASRGIPREVNNLMKLARINTLPGGTCGREDAYEVLRDAGLTRDGLTADMQETLKWLLLNARQVKADGEVIYRASVTAIATAIGKSRDSKAVALRVEPYLVKRGLMQTTPGGRILTQRGVERAERLLEGCHV